MSFNRASVVLAAAFATLVGVLILRTGVTYDEPPYAAVAELYASGRPGQLAREYPPLPSYLRALAMNPLSPSLPMPPAGRERESFSPHDYGQLFLFSRGPAAATALLRAARAPSLLMGLLLAFVLWRWGQALGGASAAAAALLWYAFEPNLLAHASLATTDVYAAALSCAALLAWASFLREGREISAWTAGAAAGAAIASKATGVILLPAFALSLAASRGRKLSARDGEGLLRAFAAACAVAVAFFAPTGLGHLWEMFTFRSRQMSEPSPTYFFGAAYHEGHPLYFPGLLLVKTSAPLLLLAVLGVKRLWKERRADALAAGAALAILLGASLLGRRQMGVRHVLLVYPMLCLAAGAAAADLWKRRAGARPWIAGALLWHVLSSLAAFPHPLAYVNELAGGPRNARNVLGDSNLDWGQATPLLDDFMRAHPGGLILSYFGKDCPRAHGLEYQEAFCTPNACPGASRPLAVDIGQEWLAVGATKWQGFYEYGPPAWGWLHEKKPYAVLGYSLLIYDVTKDRDAHERLAAMYERAGDALGAKRERARVEFLKNE